jgi:CIC family chloride channel protein
MGYPVCSRTGKCVGIVTFHDIDEAMSRGHIAEPVRWCCTRRPVTIYQTDTLEKALQKMGEHDIGHIPVVSRKDRKKLRGFITKGDILREYAKAHMEEKKSTNFWKLSKKRKGKKKVIEDD